MHLNTRSKFIRRFFALVINTVVLIGCCGLIVFLQVLQKEAAETEDPEDTDNPLTRFMAILISLAILGLNTIIKFTN